MDQWESVCNVYRRGSDELADGTCVCGFERRWDITEIIWKQKSRAIDPSLADYEEKVDLIMKKMKLCKGKCTRHFLFSRSLDLCLQNQKALFRREKILPLSSKNTWRISFFFNLFFSSFLLFYFLKILLIFFFNLLLCQMTCVVRIGGNFLFSSIRCQYLLVVVVFTFRFWK